MCAERRKELLRTSLLLRARAFRKRARANRPYRCNLGWYSCSRLDKRCIASAHLPSIAADAAKIARDQGMADQLKALYIAKDEPIKAAGQAVATYHGIPNDHGGSWAPATLSNAMIAPHTKFAIKGVIWYRGETDAFADRAPNYKRVFFALIEDWRQQWAQGELPFLSCRFQLWLRRGLGNASRRPATHSRLGQ